jgi:hypothetical protein
MQATLRRRGADQERGGDPDDISLEWRDDRPVPEPAREPLGAVPLDLLEPYVEQSVESSSPSPDGDGPSLLATVAALRSRPFDRAVVRQVLADPPSAVAAFDRWLATTSGRVLTRKATLHLGVATAGAGESRTVPSQLRLRHSPLVVPLELELLAWGRHRCAVCLRPIDRFWRGPAPDRYFAAAHAVMDVVVTTLRRSVERR